MQEQYYLLDKILSKKHQNINSFPVQYIDKNFVNRSNLHIYKQIHFPNYSQYIIQQIIIIFYTLFHFSFFYYVTIVVFPIIQLTIIERYLCFVSNKFKAMIIDIFQDKRVYINQKRKSSVKGMLPQLKYTPSVLRKMHEDIVFANHSYSKNYSDEPLTNFLISKRIGPPMRIQEYSPLLANKRNHQQVHSLPNHPANGMNTLVKRQSKRKLHKQNPETQQRMNSSSLSGRSRNIRVRQMQCFQLIDSSETKQGKTKSQQYTFLLGKGNNNQQLIKQILLARKNWKQVKWGECIPNLRWVFFNERKFYKKMPSYHQRRAINHFEFNDEITTKDNLIRNLQIYCQTKKLQMFTITPVTFIIDFDQQYCEYNLKQFLSFFLKNDPRKTLKKPGPMVSYNFVNKFMGYMAWQNSDIKKKVNILSRPINNTTYYSQTSYIWLLKPTGLNRGRGIQIFDNLQQLEKILLDYMNLMNRKKLNDKPKQQTKSQKLQQSKQVDSSPETLIGQSKFSSEKFKLNKCSFIIQKYVEKPFLIQGRKFDIRVWVLLTQNLGLYFFKEGYIRTSTQLYSTQNIDNYFIHLTNNAIQKNSQNYGQFENGNQLSFKQLSKYVEEEKVRQIWERIKQISYMTFSSIKKKINFYKRKFCFEIFGLDYIIDDEKKVWLIEINQNPCIECSSPLLGQLIPRMINDAFKLTIDQVFYEKKIEEVAYPVDGYSNTENMWQNIGVLAPNADYSPKKNEKSGTPV